jgi:hypothetical protein
MSHIDLCSREQKVYKLYLTMHACRYEKGRNEITRGTENAAGDKERRYINPEETSELENGFIMFVRIILRFNHAFC